MNVELNLTDEEVNNILHVLGELPTRMNAYPLLMKIKEQQALITTLTDRITALENK